MVRLEFPDSRSFTTLPSIILRWAMIRRNDHLWCHRTHGSWSYRFSFHWRVLSVYSSTFVVILCYAYSVWRHVIAWQIASISAMYVTCTKTFFANEFNCNLLCLSLVFRWRLFLATKGRHIFRQVRIQIGCLVRSRAMNRKTCAWCWSTSRVIWYTNMHVWCFLPWRSVIDH